MRFEVGTLLRGAVGSVESYRVDEALERSDGAGAAERITGNISLMKTARGVLVTAHLGTRQEGQCSRCLRPLAIPLAIDFEEEYVATADARTGSPLPLPEEDEDSFLIDEEQVLDLDEAVEQYRVVAQPLQLLCRPDCKGLCPQCGQDLNVGTCSCAPEEVDSRLRALARVKDELKTSD